MKKLSIQYHPWILLLRAFAAFSVWFDEVCNRCTRDPPRRTRNSFSSTIWHHLLFRKWTLNFLHKKLSPIFWKQTWCYLILDIVALRTCYIILFLRGLRLILLLLKAFRDVCAENVFAAAQRNIFRDLLLPTWTTFQLRTSANLNVESLKYTQTLL